MLALMTAPYANAGPYADDMAKCLVKATSEQDRTLLIKWLFSAMALHPELVPYTALQQPQRDELTRGAAELFQRLMLDTCRVDTEQALKNEGPQTIEYAFQILGQVAMRGLMGEPHVAEGISSLDKYTDKEKTDALMSPLPK